MGRKYFYKENKIFLRVMEDDGFDSGSEGELSIAQRDWVKMQERSLTQGYREGVTQGAEQGLQAAFDSAYTRGFTRGRECGRVRGRLAAKKFISSDKPEIIETLDSLEQELNSLERSPPSDINAKLVNFLLKLS